MPSNHRYCCVCKHYGGKVVAGKKVSMHRFPVDAHIRRIWIQRCSNARPNFAFVNSDQTRICGHHFVDRVGPTKKNPLPCVFPRPDGTNKVYTLSTISEIPEEMEWSNITRTATLKVKYDQQAHFDAGTEAPGLDITATGINMTEDLSNLDVSLKFHDYVTNGPVPLSIRHQTEQVQPDVQSVWTQTDIPIPCYICCACTHTQSQTMQQESIQIKTEKPDLTFDNACDDGKEVSYSTGVSNSGTIYQNNAGWCCQES